MRSLRAAIAKTPSVLSPSLALGTVVLWLTLGVETRAEGERYGAIEIGAKGIKAVAIAVPGGEGKYIDVLVTKTANVTIGALVDGRFKEKAIDETVRVVNEAFQLLRDEYAVRPDRIQLVGSSFVGSVSNRNDLRNKLREKTGREVKFLEVEEEVKSTLEGLVLLNNRSAALLVDIGSGNTKGGWVADSTGAFRTFNIPFGSVSYTVKVNESLKTSLNSGSSAFLAQARALADDALAKQLADKVEAQPELLNPSSIYLSGGAVWAMTTILYPEKQRDRQIPISVADVEAYRSRLARDPGSFPDANFAQISDQKLRSEAEAELQSVRRAFTVDNLIAGAEILHAIATQLQLEGKSIIFPREGQFAVAVAMATPRSVIDDAMLKVAEPIRDRDAQEHLQNGSGDHSGLRRPPVPSKTMPAPNNGAPQAIS